VKLLLDANVSWRLTKPLKNHFPYLAHILDSFAHNANDNVIWEHAAKEGYTIVTNDEDFVKLLSAKGWPPKVILLKTGNQSNSYLLELLINKKKEIELFLENEELGVLVIK